MKVDEPFVKISSPLFELSGQSSKSAKLLQLTNIYLVVTHLYETSPTLSTKPGISSPSQRNHLLYEHTLSFDVPSH